MERLTGIRSLVRAFRLLAEIARHREGIGLANLRRVVHPHGSMAFHLAETLATPGRVREDGATKRHRLGLLPRQGRI